MDYTQEVFIKLLSEYIDGNWDFTINEEKVDWNQLVELSSIHSVCGIIYLSLKEKNVNRKNLMDYLQSRFNKESGFAIRQQIVYDRTLSLFEKYGIKNVVSKGYVLKKLYPNEEVRTMGDMDILISEENSKKTDEMLKENGYTIDNVFVNEIGYAKSGCAIEIHTSLMDDDLGNDFDYSSYFKEKSKYALPYRGEYTYVLKNEDHLIYLLAHIAKHFYNEGCGIRMIMDIAVFTKKYMSSLDWDYIFGELKNIKLFEFSNNIFYLCNKWFGVKVTNHIMSDELYKAIFTYIMEGGTFGFHSKMIGTKLVRNEKNRNAFVGIFNWFFPKDELMRKKLPWYKEKPKFLLPIAWVIMWFRASKSKNSVEVEKIKNALNGRKEAEKEFKLLKELGLYQK